jgi:hypothetical protein
MNSSRFSGYISVFRGNLSPGAFPPAPKKTDAGGSRWPSKTFALVAPRFGVISIG